MTGPPCAGMALAALLATAVAAADEQQAGRYDQRSRAQALDRDVSFLDPPTLRPARHGTRITLDVRYAENSLNGVRVRHRSYNGGLFGPVIRVRRGTPLDVRLENNLPNEAP